jgi:nicotinamidase-related amidase
MPSGNRPQNTLHRLPAALLGALICLGAFLPLPGGAGTPVTIIDEWTNVRAPAAPALKPVAVDPATTAFLILDIATAQCNAQRRPRCVASVPAIAAFLARATGRKMPVVYSVATGGKPEDILWEVRPLPGQPVVSGSVDKFQGTNLDAILKGMNIKAVIISGTAAQGAVLYTASAAALRGYQVEVPLDLVSADIPYAEQYTAWHLLNAPAGIGTRVTLTRSDLIRF